MTETEARITEIERRLGAIETAMGRLQRAASGSADEDLWSRVRSIERDVRLLFDAGLDVLAKQQQPAVRRWRRWFRVK